MHFKNGTRLRGANGRFVSNKAATIQLEKNLAATTAGSTATGALIKDED